MTDQVKQVGMRIKGLREVYGKEPETVAKQTGIELHDYLSYEAGEVDIPISFLLKLSKLYDVDTTTILTGQTPRLSVCALTRRDMGVEIMREHHYVYKNLAYNFTGRRIEPLLVTVDPDANRDMQTERHSGHEFDYVLEGTLHLRVGQHDMLLEPGDSAYYDSIYPHAMSAEGGVPCKLLAMVIPIGAKEE
ncbi:MAG: cupin domain-containing protein [Clostridia bacterium]|nr:cupin domain-containing protein [Clostridia bacterium]